MKVLMVNKFHYKKGGSETYYFTAAQALQRKGHEVIFFAMSDEKNEPCSQSDFFVSNVDYNSDSLGPFKKIQAGMKLVYSLESKRNMKLLIEHEKPDLAILNLVHRQITLSVIDALHDYKIPIFFVMHDLICVCPNYTMISHHSLCKKCLGGHFLYCALQKCVKSSLPKSLLATAEAYFYKCRKTYDKVDLYIAPSAFIQDKLIESKFTASPILLMRNPLPPDTVYRLPVSVDDYFLYFGRLSPEKGLLTLLQAVKKMQPEINLTLWLVGDGPQRRELEQYTLENQLTDQVSFLGFQTGEKLENMIERCRSVVLPSEWYENCPYSVMEAMAKGKPCIVSALGGLPELVEDGKTGFVFQSKNVDSLCDGIRKLLLLSEKEYSEMCLHALEKAKKEFNPEQYIDRLMLAYNQLKAKKGETRNE